MSKDLLAPMETVDQVIPNCHCLVCGSSEDLLLARGIGTGGRVDYGVRLAAVCSACGARSPVERITGPRVQRLCTDDVYAAEVVSLLWPTWKACTALTVDAKPVPIPRLGELPDQEIRTDTRRSKRHACLRDVVALQRRNARLTFRDALNLYLARRIEGETFEDSESCPDLCGDTNVAISYLNTRCAPRMLGAAHPWTVVRVPSNGFGSSEQYTVKMGDRADTAPTFGVAAALALLGSICNDSAIDEPLIVPPLEPSDVGSSDKGSFDKGSSDKGSPDKGSSDTGSQGRA